MDKVIRIILERCCGRDVHKKNMVACVIMPETREIRSFGTMTEDREAMIEWVKSQKAGIDAAVLEHQIISQIA